MSTQPNMARSALVQLIELDEAERQRIAHVLHSDVGQSLTAALLSLQFFAEGGLPPDEIEGVAESVRDALHQVRALSLQLRPPLLDEIGLGAALASSLEQISLRRGFSVELNVPDTADRSAGWLAISLFRWVQALAEQTPADTRLRVALRMSTADAARLEVSLTGAAPPVEWAHECAARAHVLGASVEVLAEGVRIRVGEFEG